MSVDKTYSDLVRALEAISSRSNEANDMAVDKAGSTVEYFRALVEAQKETSKKAQGSGSVKLEPDFQFDGLPGFPISAGDIGGGSGGGSDGAGGESVDPWLPMIPGDEFLDILKNSMVSSNSSMINNNNNNNELPFFPGQFSNSNLSSMFDFPNGTFPDIGDDGGFLFNGSFRFGLDLASGFTNLSNLKDILGTFKQNLDENSKLSESVIYSLITIYSLIIVFGILGNILILWAVLGREAMRTARNVFVGTLATSDLFLCIFTMPSTLWEVRHCRGIG